jgi:hypothetical protein
MTASAGSLSKKADCERSQPDRHDPVTIVATSDHEVRRPVTVIGPIWLKASAPPGGSLRPDFERVLALDFDNLIAGHGRPKLGGAKDALARNVARLP